MVSNQFPTKNPQFGFLTNGFDNTTCLMCLIGQPGRTLMHWESYMPKSSYDLHFSGAAWARWQLSPGDIFLESKEPCWPLIGGLLTPAQPVGPHGTTLPVGTSLGNHYIFMNGGDKLDMGAIAGQFNTMNGELRFDILRWTSRATPPVMIAEAGTVVAGGNIATATLWTATTPGYYAVSFSHARITGGDPGTGSHETFWAYVANTDHGWRIRNFGDLDPATGGDASLLEDCRFNGVSLLISNSTSQIQKSGNVIAARIKNTDPIYVTSTELDRTGERYSGLAAEGCYTFKECTEATAQFVPACTKSPGGSYLCYDLDFDDFYHFIALSTVETLRQNFFVTYAANIEFKTDVARYAKGVADCDYTALLAARRLIASNPVWFYENPLHAAQIYRFVADNLRRGARYLVDNSGTIAGLVGAAAPKYAIPAQLLAQALQSLKV